MGRKHPPYQDEITITLQTQKTITHETVRISVTVQAQVAPDQSETDFRKQVQRTLREFVPGEWKIQSVQRGKGNQFENVIVRAIVRVSEKEDYQLEARATKVSKIGFELVGPRAEYELTFDEIQAVNAELRLTLIKQALSECDNFNEAFADAGYNETEYRISSTRFDAGNVMNMANNRMPIAHAMIASSASPSPMGGGMMPTYQDFEEGVESDGSQDMGVTTRFSMVGTFVLRSAYE